MKITALAPWFGGKRTMAPQIVEALGPHKSYWEPFCGGLAVLFSKPQSTMETVNDLHGDLVNLARVIQDEEDGLWLYEQAAKLLFCETFYQEALHRLDSACPDQTDRNRALDYLVVAWFGRNGEAGLDKKPAKNIGLRYDSGGGNQATRWSGVLESIPAWHQRLQGVTILRRDGFSLLEKIRDEAGTAIYCDPPYLEKGSRYIHDFEAADHARLTELLSRYKNARVVVSYYDHPRLLELYPRWQKIDCSRAKNLNNANGAPGHAPEVLLIGGGQ